MITNLLTVTDAKNQIATYTYDNMARLKMRADALNRGEIYGYDFSNVAATFEPKGC
jgi:YD repeat-containing protein